MFTRSRAFITVNRDIFKGSHVVTNLPPCLWGLADYLADGFPSVKRREKRESGALKAALVYFQCS
jgi:hypothetical protein